MRPGSSVNANARVKFRYVVNVLRNTARAALLSLRCRARDATVKNVTDAVLNNPFAVCATSYLLTTARFRR